VWLRRLGKPTWFTLAPMVLVMAVTIASLVLQIRVLGQATPGTAPWLNGLVSLILFGLALVLIGHAVRAWRAPIPRATARDASVQ
jgi:carbon starvation protein